MRVSLVWLVCSTSLRWADRRNRTSFSLPSNWLFLSFCRWRSSIRKPRVTRDIRFCGQVTPSVWLPGPPVQTPGSSSWPWAQQCSLALCSSESEAPADADAPTPTAADAPILAWQPGHLWKERVEAVRLSGNANVTFDRRHFSRLVLVCLPLSSRSLCASPPLFAFPALSVVPAVSLVPAAVSSPAPDAHAPETQTNKIMNIFQGCFTARKNPCRNMGCVFLSFIIYMTFFSCSSLSSAANLSCSFLCCSCRAWRLFSNSRFPLSKFSLFLSSKVTSENASYPSNYCGLSNKILYIKKKTFSKAEMENSGSSCDSSITWEFLLLAALCLLLCLFLGTLVVRLNTVTSHASSGQRNKTQNPNYWCFHIYDENLHKKVIRDKISWCTHLNVGGR